MKRARVSLIDKKIIDGFVKQYVKFENEFCSKTIKLEKKLNEALGKKYTYEFVGCNSGWFLCRHLPDKFPQSVKLVIHDFEVPNVS